MTLLAADTIGKVNPNDYPLLLQGNTGLSTFLSDIVAIVIYAAAATALIFIIIGSIQWMLAGGDPKSVSQARGKVVTAVIGLAVILSTLAILRLVQYFLQVGRII